MMAVEHRLVTHVDALGDPDAVVIRIHLVADRLPGGGTPALLAPKKEHRLAVHPQIGWMVGMNAERVAQHLHHAARAADEGAGGLYIQRQLEAAPGSHVQHPREVALGLVVGATPRAVPTDDECVDARALRLRDLTVHRAGIAANVGLGGKIGHLGRRPGVLVEPGVVKGQHQPLALCVGLFGQQSGHCQSDGDQQSDPRQHPSLQRASSCT